MSRIFQLPRQVPIVSGVVSPGAKANFFLTLTTTPTDTYQDAALTTPHMNPVVADAAGEFATIYLDPDVIYKLTLDDTNDALIYTEDPVQDALTQANIGLIFYPRSVAEISAGVTPTNFFHIYGDVRRYGAVGDGVADETTALQNALDTGHHIKGHKGDTYSITPLTQTTNNQSIDFTGATLKLQASQSSFMLNVAGDNVLTIGGIYDGNKAAGQSTSNSFFDHSAVNVSGDYCTVRGVTGQNSAGLGISGQTANFMLVTECLVKGFDVEGIYLESVTADAYGNRVITNRVEYGTDSHGVGIYIIGKADLTFKQFQWVVANNIVIGRTSGTTTADVLITLRAEDGVCTGNITENGDMGISADSTHRSTISNNRIGPTNGSTNYGIECNGSYNSITGNYIKGCLYSITGSDVLGMDGNTITGNVFDKPTSRGVYFVPSVGFTANYLNITGNTFNFDGIGANREAIYLKNDCRYALIQGNQFIGPSSSFGTTIFLDTITGFSSITVMGNVFQNWLRSFSAFSAAADTYTDLAFNYNDCRTGMASQTFFLQAIGSAIIGTDCVQIGNIISSGLGIDYIDRATDLVRQFGTGTPEGALTASPGSVFHRTNGGAGTSLYIKETGTGDTGWVAK